MRLSNILAIVTQFILLDLLTRLTTTLNIDVQSNIKCLVEDTQVRYHTVMDP